MSTSYDNIVTDLGCVIASVSSPVKCRLVLPVLQDCRRNKDKCIQNEEAAAIIIVIVTVQTLK